MMRYDDSTKAFLDLVRAGLWEQNIKLSLFSNIDYNKIYRLAEEQSVIGIVASGLENVVDLKVPQDFAVTLAGYAIQLEQRNMAMNAFVAKIIGQLRDADIYAILVKGQGVAQCYERPLWRSSGDVDLLLNNTSYDKAKAYLLPLANAIEEEDKKRKHLGIFIDSWLIELHGTLHTRQLRKVNKVVDKVQRSIFYEGRVRSWYNGKTQVFLPSADNDIIFIFSHILQHFFGGGIGLRQICDWCRLLWTYKETIDKRLLESRLREMQVMTEWQTFAYLAVNTLGMPETAIPFYSPRKKWGRKAEKVLDFIFETGNFGHNRDNSFRKGSTLRQKIGSLRRYTVDTVRHFSVFPLNSMRTWWRMITLGLELTIKGKSHE